MVFNGIEVRFLMALVQWCSCFLFSGEFVNSSKGRLILNAPSLLFLCVAFKTVAPIVVPVLDMFLTCL